MTQPLLFTNFPTPSDYEDGETSDLSEIFDLQRDLMDACGLYELPDDVAMLLTAQNLQGEVSEAVAGFGDATKPWKRKAGLQIDLEHTKEEWVDILFFWVQGAICLGLSAQDVRTLYVAKNIRNFERIQEKKG